MDANKTADLIEQIKQLSYKDKKQLYSAIFSTGYLASNELNDRLALFSLMTLTYQKLKLKDKSITPLQILMKMTGQVEDNSGFYHFLEALSIIIEDLSYGVDKIDSFGIKTSQEIINKIKDLLAMWLPF